MQICQMLIWLSECVLNNQWCWPHWLCYVINVFKLLLDILAIVIHICYNPMYNYIQSLNIKNIHKSETRQDAATRHGLITPQKKVSSKVRNRAWHKLRPRMKHSWCASKSFNTYAENSLGTHFSTWPNNQQARTIYVWNQIVIWPT